MQLVRESLYDDIYYFNVLNESVLNEDFNIKKLRDIISKIKNKSEVLNKFIEKFNETKKFSVKKHISTILMMLFLANFVAQNSIFSETDLFAMSNKVAKENTIDIKKLDNIAKANKVLKKLDYKTAKTSTDTKKLIKEHEKLRLIAYAIGDGRITIGYGHAYPEKKSPYKVGDKISEEKAEKLFAHDITVAENGIKRMLSQWEKDGIKLHIDQSMFDAMVSMAYNIGISGFRQTEFVQYLKKGNYKAAAEEIKNTMVSSKFPGLVTRRQQEYELFAQNL
jgi:lysozyme